MQRLTRAIAFVATAALLLAAAPGAAQPDRPRGPRPGRDAPERLINEHAEELGLDQATQSAIQAIVEGTREEAQKLHSAHRQAAGTLEQLLELDEPDVDSVMNQADIVAKLESQLRKLRLRGMLEIRALLTPEQREKLVEIQHPRRTERRERMQACRPDAIRLCHGASRPRRVLQCLNEHRDELSQECGEAFDTIVEDMTRQREGRPPWE